MTIEELQKLADKTSANYVVYVNGDHVNLKHVEHEIGNVEKGGTGIVINNYSNNKDDKTTTVSDEKIKNAIEELQEAKDEQGNYIMHDKDQWYAVFRVLNHYCGYPAKPKDFEITMKNIGSDNFRLPCNYENFRKVALNHLPQNVSLWKQFTNKADQHSFKQINVAEKLMEILNLE